jgi:hypothetical protein
LAQKLTDSQASEQANGATDQVSTQRAAYYRDRKDEDQGA